MQAEGGLNRDVQFFHGIVEMVADWENLQKIGYFAFFQDAATGGKLFCFTIISSVQKFLLISLELNVCVVHLKLHIGNFAMESCDDLFNPSPPFEVEHYVTCFPFLVDFFASLFIQILLLQLLAS